MIPITLSHALFLALLAGACRFISLSYSARCTQTSLVPKGHFDSLAVAMYPGYHQSRRLLQCHQVQIC